MPITLPAANGHPARCRVGVVFPCQGNYTPAAHETILGFVAQVFNDVSNPPNPQANRPGAYMHVNAPVEGNGQNFNFTHVPGIIYVKDFADPANPVIAPSRVKVWAIVRSSATGDVTYTEAEVDGRMTAGGSFITPPSAI